MTIHKRLQLISFLLLLLFMGLLAVGLVWPFADILVLGFILAVLFRPLFHWFLRLSGGGRHGVAAGATLVVMLLVLLLPLVLLGQAIFNQSLDLYSSFKSGELVLDKSQIIGSLPAAVRDFVQTTSQDLNTLISRLTVNAFKTFSSLVSNLATFLLSFFLTMFTAYYLLKDGHHFKQVIVDISPIDNKQEQILFDKISAAVNGVVKGQFLTALAQGIVAGIGYRVFGLENFLLWAVFTGLAALVPTVGTSIALVPAVGYLLITGHTSQAIGLAVYGAVAVGLIDNLIGPRLLGRTTRVHPLLMLVAVLGGVSVFGFLGFLLGPILMAVFVAMVDMYRKDFQAYLQD